MAKTGTQTIEQRILLVLEERLTGAGKAAKALKDIITGGTKASDALDDYADSAKKASKETSRFTKASHNLGIASKVFVGTSGLLYSRLVKGNKAFLEMGVAVAHVDVMMAQLHKRNKDMITSMQDAAETIGMFVRQSLAARAILSESPELAANIMKAQEKLAKRIGDKAMSKKMFQEFTNAIPATMLKDIFANPEVFGTQELFDRLQRFDSSAALIYARIKSGLNDVSKSIDPNIQGVIAWEKFMSRLKTTVDYAAVEFMKRFGKSIPAVLKHIEGTLIPQFLDAVDNIGTWIGNNGDKITNTLNGVTDGVSGLLGWILKLHPALQMLLGSVAFIPGTIPVLLLVGKSVSGIIKHTWGAVKSVVALQRSFVVLKAASSTNLAVVGKSFGAIAASVGLLTIGITAAAAAAYQFYKYFSAEGAGDTWGAKLTDKFWDYEGKQSEANRKMSQSDVMKKSNASLAKKHKVDVSKVQEWRKKGKEQTLGEYLKPEAGKSMGKAMDWAKDKIAAARAAVEKLHQKLLAMTSGAQFEKYAEEWKEVAAGMSAAAASAGSLETIMSTGGFNANVGGITASEAAGLIAEELGVAAKEGRRIGNEMAKNALLMLASAKGGKARTQALDKLQQGLSKVAESEKLIEQRISAATVKIRIKGDLQKQITALNKADMEISKNLYGSAALAVQAQLQLVDSLQREKDLKQSELAIIQQLIKEEGETPILLKKERDARLEIKNITNEQLSTVRQLRDGYLDAVQAQAFGAGKFEKILITQEKNMGQALDKNIAKKNIFLGQSGKDARAGDLQSSRYGEMGQLKDSAGNVIDPAKRGQEFVDNISEGTQKGLAQASVNLFGKVSESTNRNTEVSAQNTEAVQKNTDAINKYAKEGQKAAGALALKGSPAGSVAIGEAVRKAASGKGGGPLAGVPTLKAVDYEGGVAKKAAKLNPKEKRDAAKQKREQKKINSLNKQYKAISDKISAMQSRDTRPMSIGGITQQVSAGKADVQGFDMRSVNEIKKARAKNKTAVRKLERQKKALIPRIAKQKARMGAATIPKSAKKPSSGGGAMENVGKKMFDLLFTAGKLAMVMGANQDEMSQSDPDQVVDHPGRYATNLS